MHLSSLRNNSNNRDSRATDMCLHMGKHPMELTQLPSTLATMPLLIINSLLTGAPKPNLTPVVLTLVLPCSLPKPFTVSLILLSLLQVNRNRTRRLLSQESPDGAPQ